MYGIVTVTDGELGQRIESLWTAISAAHGEAAVRGFSVPHLSYHVADDYDRDAVAGLLERVAAATAPFHVPTYGVGLFPPPHPLIFVTLGRTPPLNALQDALWDEATGVAEGTVMRYHRDRWLPHVTFADKPVVLDEIVRHLDALGADVLRQPLPIDNLALVEEVPSGHETRLRYPLTG